MSIHIPADPEVFFTAFFPEQFTNHRDRYPVEDTRGAAVFEVFGAGSWNIRIQNGALQVAAGTPEDTLLKIGLSAEDFQTLFIERTQAEVHSTGAISNDSIDAFRPLFINDRKRKVAENARGTLAFSIKHDKSVHSLLITPGTEPHGQPRTTIRTHTKALLGLLSGRKKPTSLFMLGKLKVKGDVGYALRMSGLLR